MKKYKAIFLCIAIGISIQSEMIEDEYLDDFGDMNHNEKRAWNSGFASGLGKRAWNSGMILS